MDQILQAVQDGGIYVINGGLRALYFAADHAALLIGLLSVLIIAGLYDRWLAGLANTRPDRAGQPAPYRRVARPYVRTLITGALWLLAASLYPTPVPESGAAMWVTAVVVVLWVPVERSRVLARFKDILLGYSCALLVFLWYSNTLASASPRDWAAIIGGVGEAQQTLAQNQSLVMTIGTIGLTWSGPFAIATYAFRTLTSQLESLANARQTAAQIVREIVTRT